MTDYTTLPDCDERLAEHDRDALPDGWSGGETRHTGGGIWCREFYHEERGLRVIYSLNSPGVGVERVSQNPESGHWRFEELIDSDNSVSGDGEKFARALDFMENIDESL